MYIVYILAALAVFGVIAWYVAVVMPKQKRAEEIAHGLGKLGGPVGKSYAEIVKVLGKPDETRKADGGTIRVWTHAHGSVQMHFDGETCKRIEEKLSL